MKIYVSYGRTVSANYQSKKYEFGFFAEEAPAKAFQLCEAVVNEKLGQKTDLTRAQADALARKFFRIDFDTLIGCDNEEV